MTKLSIIAPAGPNRDLLKDFLNSKGHSTSTFDHPQGFLEQTIEPAGTDLLIFDLSPHHSSEVGAAIQSFRDKQRGLPILLLIENTGLAQAIEGVRMGVFHYLLKPIVMTDLAAFVEIALSSRSRTVDVDVLFQDYPTIEELEKRYMKAVLEKTRGRKEKAAKILGINRRTLYRKEREYGWVTEEAEGEEVGGNA